MNGWIAIGWLLQLPISMIQVFYVTKIGLNIIYQISYTCNVHDFTIDTPCYIVRLNKKKAILLLSHKSTNLVKIAFPLLLFNTKIPNPIEDWLWIIRIYIYSRYTHFATILLEFRLFLFSSHLNVWMSVKVNYIKKKEWNEYGTSTYNALRGRCGTSNFVSKSNKLLHKFGITMAYAYTNQFCFMFLPPFVRFSFLFS